MPLVTVEREPRNSTPVMTMKLKRVSRDWQVPEHRPSALAKWTFCPLFLPVYNGVQLRCAHRPGGLCSFLLSSRTEGCTSVPRDILPAYRLSEWAESRVSSG